MPWLEGGSRFKLKKKVLLRTIFSVHLTCRAQISTSSTLMYQRSRLWGMKGPFGHLGPFSGG